MSQKTRAACRFEVDQELISMFVRCSCLPVLWNGNMGLANFEKCTGSFRMGDFFQTIYVTCDERRAVYIGLCRACVIGGVSDCASGRKRGVYGM